MLSLTVFLPLAGALALLLLPLRRPAAARALGLAVAAVTLGLILALWLRFEPGAGMQFAQRLAWMPSLGIGYAVSIDGLSLPLMLLAGLLTLAALFASWDELRHTRGFHAAVLALETGCLGVLAAQDLLPFFAFWMLALLAMYFLIAVWGHADARAAALRFFLYAFAGAMALLLAIVALYLWRGTLDLAALAQSPLPAGPRATLLFYALLAGFGVISGLIPLHGWMAPAHAEAPAAGSALLAGVVLKLGAYGMLRVMLPLLPETMHAHAWLLFGLGLVGVIYGALLTLAQRDLKRLIAYSSLTPMGYVLLGIGAAAWLGTDPARRLALNGALLQMVSHGLIVASLFLLAGALWRRTQRFDLAAFGGLARAMPVYGGAFALAAFAALGLPGLSGFIAEFQIFAATFRGQPWVAGVALLGIVLTAGVFLWTLQRLLLGVLPERWRRLPDLHWFERAAVLPLLALVLAIGLAPAWILRVMGGDEVEMVAQTQE